MAVKLHPSNLSSSQPQRVPYLEAVADVVDVSCGRQLFVDDYLLDIQAHSMARVWHKPVAHTGNPVLWPESSLECHGQYAPCAIAKGGGVWFDDADGMFKMWYQSGYTGFVTLAVSADGLHWKRPIIDTASGTNQVLTDASGEGMPLGIHPDSGAVVIDHNAPNPAERYKMLVREPNCPGVTSLPACLFTSPDGIHWKQIGKTSPMDDRSTFFYNPFRKAWVQSIRYWDPVAMRCRYYHEAENFLASGQWTEQAAVPWMRADNLDCGRFGPAQLYNFDAIAYESVMIGFHQILHGPNNDIGHQRGEPKLTELQIGFSRDGLHWYRPERTPFIGAHREYGSWDFGYVESSAGMCLIVGDELWFYYTAYAGDEARVAPAVTDWVQQGIYANGAVGLARLRRDGFASMRPVFAGATIATRKLSFAEKASRLFVNANTVGSVLSVQVMDEDGQPVLGLSHEDCLGFRGNSTCTEVRWRDKTLAGLGRQKVRLEFRMDRGDLYSFWITENPHGKSGGYIAAGGPGLSGDRDV